MGTVSSLTIDSGSLKAAQLSGYYSGVVIIIVCAFCFTPIELFIVEIWPRHGFLSLLCFILPLGLGLIAAKNLPNRYFEIKRFESSGRVYEYLGIRLFRYVVPRGIYINKAIRRLDPTYRVVGGRESVCELEASTRYAERSHVASLLLMLPIALYALMLGWTTFALVIVLPNIPLHLYPVLLQRYTRARVVRYVEKSGRKS